MDKYEYNLKLDQMKSFLAEGKYDDAVEIADSINWNKVKNVNALVKAGEVYEKAGRYEESRDILLDAYDKSPIGRTIIYRLAEVAIKMKDFEAALEYYEEFVEIAPHDNQKYILKYEIKKAQGAENKELIPIMEEFKEQEYSEEWAYELAYLYHKESMIDKCIDACDELILWFGDGPYVERALELKMLYQPLTKTQEEKYREFHHQKNGATFIGASEMERAGEYVHDPVVIPQIKLNPSRFNTMNLQEEIVKGIQQIMDATEKETVVGTMDNIKKIAEEIPYLQLPTEEELAAKEAAAHIETDEEIDGSLRINFQELLGEESDGQISLVMKERAMIEKQITGQMTISEVLEEWEKTKRAAEMALQEAEQRKLESAKARALQEAEDIMVRLNDVIPKIEASIAADEIKSKETGLLFESVNSILDREIERLSTENAQIDSHLQEFINYGKPVIEEPVEILEPVVEQILPEETIRIIEEEQMIVPETSLSVDEQTVRSSELELAEVLDLSVVEENLRGQTEVLGTDVVKKDLDESADILDSDVVKEDLEESVRTLEEVVIENLSEKLDENLVSKEVIEEDTIELSEIKIEIPVSKDTIELPEIKFEFPDEDDMEELPKKDNRILITEDSINSMEEELARSLALKLQETNMIPVDEIEEELEIERTVEKKKEETIKKVFITTLTEEQKAIFSYFVPVKGMEEQLCKALSGIVTNYKGAAKSSTGNLIIQGSQGCGKTMLAASIVKVLQKECGRPNGKVGKIDAEALNKKDIQQLLAKVSGGCLIIENAGALDKNSAVSLALLLEQDESGLLIILEDSAARVTKLLTKEDRLAKMFTETISVPLFTNDDLIGFAISYANELGYVIDEMAILALHNSISSIEKYDQATTLVEVKEIIDDAIYSEAHGGLRKFFSILTAKRYTDDEKIVLTEKDFE